MNDVCPNHVVVARGAIEKLSQYTAGHRVICVTDESILSIYRKQIESIVSSDIRWVLSSHEIRGIETDSASVILGFGGGRSIDTAKLLAAETGLDWISVPTAASHDGIASEAASVSQNGYRYSRKCKLPVAVIADLDIMSRAPKELKRAGTGDIISKASSLAEWKLAAEAVGESFVEDSYRTMASALCKVLEHDDLETLVHAEIDAGRAMCLAGSSRPCSGTEHAISHAMDRRGVGLHGIQVAFATPICVHFLEEIGYAIHDLNKIRRVMRTRGLPCRLHELPITLETFLDDIHHALEIMKKRGRYSVLDNFTDEDLVDSIRSLY